MNVSPELNSMCPVCKNHELRFIFKVKDFSVSGEFFDLVECVRCGLRITQNAPSGNHIGRYYQSENYISHTNTKKGLVNALYHRVRTLTLSRKARLIVRTTGKKTGDHLDIGAGTGAFVQYMNTRGWNSEGVEPDAQARARALTHHQTILKTADALADFPAESFDAVSLWHVLEHVHELYPYLHQIKSLLRPGALLYIAVPNYTSLDAVKYQCSWAAYDVPRHLWHFCPKSMQWLLNEAGFQLTREVPMWWDSYYISLLSEKYKGGTATLVKGFLSGAMSNLQAVADNEKCSSLIYIARKN